MTGKLVCLDVSWLERIKTAQLSSAEIDQVASHLEECPACAERVHGGDFIRLAAEARSGAQHADFELQPLVRDLIRKLQNLSTADTSVSDGNTAFPAGDSPENCLTNLLAPAEGPDELGRLGLYRVLRILGQGGMGLVLEAEDTLLKRLVALKVILPRLMQHADTRQRFQREARAVAALQSDHIVPIHQVGEERGVPFLAMPLLRGETLESRLRSKGKLPLMEVLRLGREIALGLSVAHEHGLIHRDIKPSNIWLEDRNQGSGASGQGDRVKIFDFGLARETNSADTRLTCSGVFLGTPAYMAPEQVDNQPLDGRCDLFSLGCVLYQLATGHMPFRGETPLAVVRSLSIDTPRSPRELNPEIPKELSDLIQELLAKDPSKRPANAAQVAQRLAKLERHLTAPSEPALTPSSAPTGMGRWLVLAACLFLTLGAVGYLFGAQIIRIVTNRGELVIEVNDPNLDVRIIQNGAVVQDKTSKREFTLTAGKGEIDVLEKDGVKLTTKQFELTRNGKTTVKVTLEELADARKLKPGPGEKPLVPSSTIPDRRAAEWVLSIGGSLRIKEDGKERPIASADKLPTGSFELLFVDLQANPKVTDAGLAHFANCKNLTRLRLGRTQVSDSGLANFKDCKNLVHLDLGVNRKMSDAGLAHFKDCKNLTHLDLNATLAGDAGLANFKGCKELLQLNLQNTSTSDLGLTYFKDCKKLRVLDLAKTQVANAGLASFEGCKDLLSLNLSANPQLSDAGLAHFKESTNLTRLYLHGTQAGDDGLVQLKNCKGLAELGLSSTQVSDRGLAELASLINLQALDVRGARVTAVGVAQLEKTLRKCKIEWKDQ